MLKYLCKQIFSSLALMILLIAIDDVTSQSCQSNFCQTNKCAQQMTSCSDGYVLVKNSTLCGCCHSCVKIGGLGDTCSKSSLQNIPSIVCGNQLTCKDDVLLPKCTQGETECLQHRNKALQMNQFAPNYIPNCDSYGDYLPYQCIRNSKCFCVDKQGKRIFGDFHYSQREPVNCACSRHLNELRQLIPDRGDSYNLPQCQSNGNYQILQRTTSRAYCLDISNNQISLNGPSVERTNLAKLSCYANSQKDYPCWTDLNDRIQTLKLLQDKYDDIIGYTLPNCDLDGSYGAKQCDENACFCVNKQGERYGPRMTILRTSLDLKQMRCNCIRDQDLMRKSNEPNILPKYECDQFGNYKQLQCHDSWCYCVDSEGFPIDSNRYHESVKNTVNCSELIKL